MQNTRVVRGRLVGPTSVELDEPVAGATTEVEVLIRPAAGAQGDSTERLSQFVRGLPTGTRSKKEIDAQLHAERSSWGEE